MRPMEDPAEHDRAVYDFTMTCIIALALAGCSGPRGVGAPPYAAPNCTDVASIPGELIASGWQRSYRAGCPDASGRIAGGSEILHLVAHRGKLYAAAGYWMDPRNPFYGGRFADGGWAQVLRLDGPDARWQVDLAMPRHLRPEILQSVTFTTDANGTLLREPVELLLASTYEGGGEGGVSLFTRDDASSTWRKSKIIAGPTGRKGEANSVRAMRVHRDAVTGIDRLFVSIGELGIYSGTYNAANASIRWDAVPELGPLRTRPLAIVEANGALLFSSGASIFRREDGASPKWMRVHDLADLFAGDAASPVGGIRGLTAIPNPAGAGQSLLFVWAPDGRSRGCVFRLDPDGAGGYRRIAEACIDSLVSRYLHGNGVYFVIAGYNSFLPVTNPTTHDTNYIVGIEAWIGGERFPIGQRKPGGGYYAGALYAIRDTEGSYRIGEVNGPTPATNPPLVSTRSYALSPFGGESAGTIYLGGYDCNFVSSSDTAWIFSTGIDHALAGSDERP